jgi:acetate kinase
MILTINAGSSNIKFALFDQQNLTLIHHAQVDTMQEMLRWLKEQDTKYTLTAIGHRIVHGGVEFFEPVLLTKEVMQRLTKLIPLAPLHEPHNLNAVEIFAATYPSIPQVGCFDTAFHVTQQKLSKLFAIPEDLTNSGIIRYGFHGLSYEYIASVMEHSIEELAYKKVIVAHLGNGSSMCAMNNRRSVATSMGFSALDGLMMGSRCGAIDPGVLLYLLQEKKYSPDKLAELLYYKSGLLGVSGLSNDVRELLASTTSNSQTAIDLYCYKAACEFGFLMTANIGCDALIFTGGIGEHAAPIRSKICTWLKCFGVELDTGANNDNATIISSGGSKIKVAVLPTDEELVIGQHTRNLLNSQH